MRPKADLRFRPRALSCPGAGRTFQPARECKTRGHCKKEAFPQADGGIGGDVADGIRAMASACRFGRDCAECLGVLERRSREHLPRPVRRSRAVAGRAATAPWTPMLRATTRRTRLWPRACGCRCRMPAVPRAARGPADRRLVRQARRGVSRFHRGERGDGAPGLRGGVLARPCYTRLRRVVSRRRKAAGELRVAPSAGRAARRNGRRGAARRIVC